MRGPRHVHGWQPCVVFVHPIAASTAATTIIMDPPTQHQPAPHPPTPTHPPTPPPAHLGDVLPAAKHLLIGGQHHLVASALVAAHAVVGVRVGGVEVEHEQQVACRRGWWWGGAHEQR